MLKHESIPAETVALTLGDGTPAVIRPLVPTDEAKLVEGLQRLSPESRIRRFLFEKSTFTPGEIQHLAHPDGCTQIALVLAILNEMGQEVDKVAVARCFRNPQESQFGEVAVATVDEWQGLGIGTALIKQLARCCRQHGILYWVATLFSGNTPMRKLLQRVGGEVFRETIGASVVQETYELR